MKKIISLSAIAAVVAVGAAFAGKPPTVYKDAAGNIVTQAYYNACGNTIMPLCATEYVNGVEVAHRNSPIP